MMSSVLDRASFCLAGMVDRLCDPKAWRRNTLLLVCAYAAAGTLYGVIAKSSQDINADMAEMVVWAREPALGYPKHPPLLAYVVKLWFAVFPLADWAFILLAMVTIAAGLYLATVLCSEWLQGDKRAAVPFLLAAIPFYNFLGLKFDQNSALIPLWALATLAFMRSLQTHRDGWAVLMGLAAAAAMLTKYWSVFLLAAFAVTVLCDHRRGDYLRSHAPWLGGGVFLLAVSPHLIWLIAERFPPLEHIALRDSQSIHDFFRSWAEYAGGTFGYAAVALTFAPVLFRPSLPAIRDSWLVSDPARRPAMLLFWTPLVLPILVSVATGTNLLSLWNAPALNLLPVMMLASPLVHVSRVAVMRLAAIMMVLTLVALAIAPAVALRRLQVGVENNAQYASLAAAATEQEWRATTAAPLRLVAGPFALASAAAFYLSDEPSTFADFSEALSPWATAERRARDGIAVICPAVDRQCLGEMDKLTTAGPPGRRGEVTLTRHWLGFVGAPRRFVIATVPPQP